MCYRKIIDARSERSWEKLLFDDTYKEFKMQHQLFDPQKKYSTFSELLHTVPAAQQLHFLVSAAATGYVHQLGEKMPDIKNNLGQSFIAFRNYRFEIIQSDTKDKSMHAVAISFISEPLEWLDTIGEYLLLTAGGSSISQETRTEMVAMQPFLSIYSLQKSGI